MASAFYIGDVAPKAVPWDITVEPDSDLTDLSIVTAAAATVFYPDGTSVVWSGLALSNQTQSTLTCQHLLQTGDLTQRGIHRSHVSLTTNVGVYETTERAFFVGVRGND